MRFNINEKQTVCGNLLAQRKLCFQNHFNQLSWVVDGVKSTYTRSSNGCCRLNIPDPGGNELKIYDLFCDAIADSVLRTSPWGSILFFRDRKELDTESQQHLDQLLQQAVEYLNNKNKKSGYNDIPF